MLQNLGNALDMSRSPITLRFGRYYTGSLFKTNTINVRPRLPIGCFICRTQNNVASHSICRTGVGFTECRNHVFVVRGEELGALLGCIYVHWSCRNLVSADGVIQEGVHSTRTIRCILTELVLIDRENDLVQRLE